MEKLAGGTNCAVQAVGAVGAGRCATGTELAEQSAADRPNGAKEEAEQQGSGDRERRLGRPAENQSVAQMCSWHGRALLSRLARAGLPNARAARSGKHGAWRGFASWLSRRIP